jgi:hypothetical protein
MQLTDMDNRLSHVWSSPSGLGSIPPRSGVSASRSPPGHAHGDINMDLSTDIYFDRVRYLARFELISPTSDLIADNPPSP